MSLMNWARRPRRRGATRTVVRRLRPNILVESLETRELLAIDIANTFPALGLDLANPQTASVVTAVGNDGSTYLAGSFVGNPTSTAGVREAYFGPNNTGRVTVTGAEDAFVAKYNANGSLAWVHTFGGSGTDNANAIAVDNSGNVYVTGQFIGTVDFDPGAGTRNLTNNGTTFDGFVLKLDTNGNFVYVADVSGNNASNTERLPLGLAVGGDGSAYVTGRFLTTAAFIGNNGSTTVTLNANNSFDGFVARLDSSGNFAWARQIPAATGELAEGRGIAVDGAGNVVTVGRFTGTADFDPGAGTLNLTAQGGYPDIFVQKLNAAGNLVWAKRIGGSDFDVGEGVGVDSAGNVYLTGKYSSPKDASGNATPVDLAAQPGNPSFPMYSRGPLSTDLFVEKLDANGNFVWARTLDVYNDTAQPGRGGIAVLPNGTVFWTGSFRYLVTKPTNRSDNQVFLAQLDSNGVFLGLRTGGSTAADIAQGIGANAAAGIVAVAGLTNGNATFGNTTLGAAADTFVARYSYNGTAKRAPTDFDGDGITDTVAFEAGTATFYISQSSLGNKGIQFGQGILYGGTNPLPVSADYDGDGRADTGVFEPSNSAFWLRRSALPNTIVQFGPGTSDGADPVPVQADYDNDGKTDVATFDRRTATFYLKQSTAGNQAFQFGRGTNGGGNPQPIPGDFNGDGRIDPAVFDRADAMFYIARSTGGTPVGVASNQLGVPGRSIGVVADFDGDGKSDYAAFDPFTSTYYLTQSSLGSSGNRTFQFGPGSAYGYDPMPIAADFNGDGKADPSVFDGRTATFFISTWNGTNPVASFAQQFGQGSQYGGDPLPIVGNFDGDNKADWGMFEKNQAFFYISRSTPGFPNGNILVQFGQGKNYRNGKPVPQPLPTQILLTRRLY